MPLPKLLLVRHAPTSSLSPRGDTFKGSSMFSSCSQSGLMAARCTMKVFSMTDDHAARLDGRRRVLVSPGLGAGQELYRAVVAAPVRVRLREATVSRRVLVRVETAASRDGVSARRQVVIDPGGVECPDG
jgi:hypothetical protein